MTQEQDRFTLSPDANSKFTIVALAASAGGLEALSEVLSHLPSDFSASIVVVQHLAPGRISLLADILGRRTSLAVKQAEEGAQLHPGVVFIAPPDRHLLINRDGTLGLSDSTQVNFSRPSADRLFESVANHFKERAIAVVLTGSGHDGAQGIQVVKQMGGVVIAQDEATADYFNMPKAAIATGQVDWILPLNQIAAALTRVVMTGYELSRRQP